MSSRPKCRICGLEDGACICAHLRPYPVTESAELARRVESHVKHLANTSMYLSLEDWGAIANDLLEAARALRTGGVAQAPMRADIAQMIDAGWKTGKSSSEVAEEILREFDASSVTSTNSGGAACDCAAIKAEHDLMRRTLETIAGTAADQLQATQARGALDNIGPALTSTDGAAP